MRMKTLRAQKTLAPRHVRRRRGGPAVDATTEPDPAPGPEAVFDRVTGPYALRPAYDEET